MKLIVLTCLFISVLFSCKKDLIDVNQNFEGEWHAAPVTTSEGVPLENYIIIDGNNGVYGEWCELDPLGSNCSSIFSGEARINKKGTRLYIGKTFEGVGKVNFDIDVPPHINADGEWECTLTERIYIRN